MSKGTCMRGTYILDRKGGRQVRIGQELRQVRSTHKLGSVEEGTNQDMK
jgi:hypothetical protein